MKEEEQDPLDMTVRELFDIAEPGKGAQMIPMSFNEDKKVGRYLIAITGDINTVVDLLSNFIFGPPSITAEPEIQQINTITSPHAYQPPLKKLPS